MMNRMNPIGGIMMKPVALRGSAWRMPMYRPRMAQAPYVQLNPQVTIEKPTISTPINIELGGLPLSLGLFAGSGIVFLLRTALPKGWPQTVALVGGAALAIGGLVNLVLPKKAAAAPAPGGPAAPSYGPPPAPSAAGGASAGSGPSYKKPIAAAFDDVTGRISSPADFSTVDIAPWASSYPVRVQLDNSKSAVPVTFELELTAEEDPQPVGKSATSVLPVQVTLNPGEVRDVDLNMPIATWGALQTYVDIMLTARKRRAPGEDAQLIDQRSFNVT